jgi:hypothetical protein
LLIEDVVHVPYMLNLRASPVLRAIGIAGTDQMIILLSQGDPIHVFSHALNLCSRRFSPQVWARGNRAAR